MLPHSLAPSLPPTLLLLVTVQILSTGECWKVSQKLRHKREWVVPFKKITENVDYSSEPYISKMRSDMDQGVPLRYTLRGPGANQPPFGCFIVDEYKGFIRITRPLDREERENYTLIGTAWFFNNTIAEDNIIVNIRVEDQNDNSPVFIKPKRSRVYERSPVGTFVTQVVAKDADKPHTLHSEIAYSIIKQEPNNGVLFFDVNKSSGEISVSNPTLDREEHSSYVLTVQAADMNGDGHGNSATTTVSVVILDVNDNIPTLEKDEFEASIEENTAQVEVIRLKVTDLDLKDTDNWAANCFIASGNEAGFFSLKMDPKTNEAILMLEKTVDYEDVKDLKLGIGVVNNAPFHPSVTGGQSGMNVNFGGSGGGGGGGGGSSSSSGGSSSSSSSYSGGQIYKVNVKVKNQPEGPKFMPLIKAIPISEGKTFNSNEIITRYPAIDEDTGEEATNVKYFKASDPDNWLSIDETTGAVRLNKAPDRESKFLVDGVYYAMICSITQEWPSKTATGTIAIQVEDFNDHCPTLLSKVLTLCTDKDAVLVTAVDEDAPPNGAPFTFNVVPEGTKGKWSIEHLNDTTAIFRTQEKMWPGEHELTVDVKDQQGVGCPEPQKIVVEVCTCTDRGACARTGMLKKGSTFGPAGICLLFLGVLALLLIPLLLLLCRCGAAGMAGAFTDMPYDTKEHLISYHTEGQGEDRDVPVPNDFTDGGGRTISLKSKDVGGMRINGVGGVGRVAGFIESNSIIGVRGYNDMELAYMDSLRRDETLMSREMAGDFDGMAVSEMFLDEYYSQKSRGLEDGFAKNEPMVYGYEGKGSPVGSVGCCSMLEDNNDLEFLNDLGPKFNTLAEICGGKKTEVHAPLPPPPKPIVDRTDVVSSSTNYINARNIATNRALSTNKMNMISNMAATSSSRVENVLVADNRPTEITSVQPAPTYLMQPPQKYYMVKPQPSTVLLAERPTMGVGQNMYGMNSGPVAEGVVVQGTNMAANTLNRGERMVLVDRGGSSQALNSGLSGSQVYLVDGGVRSGQVLQGTLQRGVAGAQGLMVVERQGGQVIHGTLQKRYFH